MASCACRLAPPTRPAPSALLGSTRATTRRWLARIGAGILSAALSEVPLSFAQEPHLKPAATEVREHVDGPAAQPRSARVHEPGVAAPTSSTQLSCVIPASLRCGRGRLRSAGCPLRPTPRRGRRQRLGRSNQRCDQGAGHSPVAPLAIGDGSLERSRHAAHVREPRSDRRQPGLGDAPGLTAPPPLGEPQQVRDFIEGESHTLGRFDESHTVDRVFAVCADAARRA